jgi:hypothetical protein
MIANMPELIDMRHAGAIYDALNRRIIDHVLACNICRKGVRCTTYIGITEIRDDLSFVEGKDQDAQKN